MMTPKAQAKRALKLRCPYCGSGRGAMCRVFYLNGTSSGVRPHQERLDKLRAMERGSIRLVSTSMQTSNKS
jgi:hypothetical protein